MRKKTKGVLALAAAALLCLSMGATVLANGSSGDQDIPEISFGSGEGTDGKRVTLKANEVAQDVKEVLKDENKVKDILKDAGFDVKDDNKVVVLGAGDFHVENDGLPEGGADFDFPLGSNTAENLKDLKDGDTIYVLHQTADGSWEVIEGKVAVKYGNVFVKAHLNSLSPIAFIKVMSNGKVVVLDKTNKPVAALDDKNLNVTSGSVKTSPKTGE